MRTDVKDGPRKFNMTKVTRASHHAFSTGLAFILSIHCSHSHIQETSGDGKLGGKVSELGQLDPDDRHCFLPEEKGGREGQANRIKSSAQTKHKRGSMGGGGREGEGTRRSYHFFWRKDSKLKSLNTTNRALGGPLRTTHVGHDDMR